MDEDENQGRGLRAPSPGFYDILLAVAIAYCVFQALLFWWGS